MKPKLIELAEILKQKPEIKERWTEEILEKWFLKEKPDNIDGIVPHSFGYHDVLEYLGDGYSMDFKNIYDDVNFTSKIHLSPGPLSNQTDETLTQIISLLKTVGKK